MGAAIHIGAASATFVDSRIAMPQLLGSGEKLDYLVFDCLAEGVMSMLARAKAAGQPAWVADFVDNQIAPHLAELAGRGIKVIANAGGLDPKGCAEALREAARAGGVDLRVASVSGDDLSDRIDTFVKPGTPDMFDGRDLRARFDAGDRPLSLTAYTGAFPIAAALAAGADIVVAGRCVDSATTLGALIHEFGWDAEDFDRLAAGTLIGHLIECTTQVSGGTFTDWQDVPDWANIGFPIAACEADGSAELYKPAETGGLISRGTAAEQMLYEVSDPASYLVPDVVCDFSGVRIEEVAENRVRVSGAKGRGRPEKLKATLTWDAGWRASAMAPIIGLDAMAKAQRVAGALFDRVARLARDRQLPAFAATHYDVIGGESPALGRAICRMVADHPTSEGAQLFAREQSSIITNTVQGLSVPLGTQVRPLTQIGSFLLDRGDLALSVEIDGEPVGFEAVAGGAAAPATAHPTVEPAEPAGERQLAEVPLVALAWVRSGDKGNLFNVGVIARDPEHLPWLWRALTPKAVGRRYAELLELDQADLAVTRYSVPGIDALNLVVENSLQGGMLASPAFDPAAKGMGQFLLEFPVPVPVETKEAIAATAAKETTR